MVPPIPGLADAPYLTNETIFGLGKRPEHLIVVGSGPLGAELAQAHRRLGAKVTILEMFNFLGKDDPELTAVNSTSRRLTSKLALKWLLSRTMPPASPSRSTMQEPNTILQDLIY